MSDTNRAAASNVTPPAIISKTPPTIDQVGNPAPIRDVVADSSTTLGLVTKPNPQYTALAGVRPLGDVVGELESVLADLESLSTPSGSDAYFQDWLREKEKFLRSKADADRKDRAGALAVQVSRLESEMKVSCEALSRKSQSVRSSITASVAQSQTSSSQ